MHIKSIRDQLDQLSLPALVPNKTRVSMALLLTLVCQPVIAVQIKSNSLLCDVFDMDCYSISLGESLDIYDYSFNSVDFSNSGQINIFSGGELQNIGALTNYYFLTNSGTLTFASGSTFTNTGVVWNNSGGVLKSYVYNLYFDLGTTSHNAGSEFINFANMINGQAASLTNEIGVKLTNSGALDNYGTLTNDGTLTNHQTLTNRYSGTLNNNGTLTNDGPLYNNSSLTNTDILTTGDEGVSECTWAKGT